MNRYKTIFKKPNDDLLSLYLEHYNINIDDYDLNNLEDVNHYGNHNIELGHKFIEDCATTEKKAIVLVDVDCDGITSSCIVGKFLLQKGITPLFIYHTNKIHGLDDEIAFNKITQSAVQLIIIPDASGQQHLFDTLTSIYNKKIICLDHHNNKVIPNEKLVVLNNKFNTKGNKDLSGAGVAWKFCQQSYNELDDMDLVGLSVISDSCVASNENRTFVRKLLHGPSNPFLIYCIKTMINKKDYNAIDLAFNVIPKINASIRMGDEILQGQILTALMETTTNIELFEEVARDMLKAHRAQSSFVSNKTNEIIKSYVSFDDAVGIVVANDLLNYTGLIANKLASTYNKPFLVCSKDKQLLTGSARSPIPFRELCEDSKLFEWNKGHSGAFGTCFQEKNTNDIIKYFNSHLSEQSADYTVCDIVADDEINKLQYIPYFQLHEQGYDYWCTNIQEPTFAINLNNIQGKDWNELKGNTIKLQKNISYIMFRVPNYIKEQLQIGRFNKNQPYDLTLVGTLGYNCYNGKRYPQMIIKHIEVKESMDNKNSFDSIW